MTILPITSGRVSLLQRSGQASATIASTEAELAAVGQELATGRAVNVASDDPSAAAVIQNLTQQMSDSDQYAANITAAKDQLSDADTTLGSLTALLTTATSTAETNVNTTTSAADRVGAAQTIDSIYSQVLSTANSTYEGRYMFGGDTAQSAPYVSTAYGVQYNASGGTLASQTDSYATLSYQVSGQAVFGGLSASVSAGTDLAPAAAATDLLGDLAGARNDGINLGTIHVGNGSTTAAVDLTGASTLQDVADDINAAGVAGVAASVTATGLTLTAGGGANITVTDADGSTAAADLGILHATAGGAGVSVAGANVNAKVVQTTKLSDLLGGAGLDTAGFNVSNGSATKTISLSGLTDVQDLVNAVNTAGLGVRATIRGDGTGVDLQNATQGADMTVTDLGTGTTAAELGFATTKAATLLSSLNKGDGVSVTTGTQFTIATADGSTVDVGLTTTSTSTVQDAIDQINAAAGTRVTASLGGGGGIVLTDHTTGPGTLAVTAANASATAAGDLGLTTGTVVGNVLTGANVNPVATPGLLSDLQNLSNALKANDTDGISKAAGALEDDSKKVTTAQAVVGARVDELASRSTAIAAQDTSNASLLSSFEDVDYATTVTQYQTLQTSLQASLEVTSRTLSLSLVDYLS